MPTAERSGKFRKRTSDVLSVLAVILTAALIILGLLVRVKLTEQNNEIVTLKKELSELKDENTRLRIEYEYAFNMAEIEEYAMDVLDMKRPYSVYWEITDTPVHDKAEIINSNTNMQYNALRMKRG